MESVSDRSIKILGGVGAAVAIFFVYFFHLTTVGIGGTDEPRYAAIARSMAASGDWITPRLFGVGWFEKPALIYWMSAIGFRMGLSVDLAPRLPVAILSAAFLLFYYWVLRREFGTPAALYSCLLLGTSAFWIAFSNAAVPDLPLAAFFSAAILLALPWIDDGNKRDLPFAAALIALAVLAKSLVPLVLLAPALWFGRKRLLDLLNARVLCTFLAIALPWYIACYARNGMPFIHTLFIQQQFGRMTSGDLQHVQSFWYYLAVLPGAIFPWIFLLPLLFRRGLYSDRRAQYLLATFVFGMVFFSASPNKLPGYILPLLPALFALIGIRLAQTRFVGEFMLASTLLLVFVPAANLTLPRAMAKGLSQVWPLDMAAAANAMLWMPNLMVAGGAEMLAAKRWKPPAAVILAAGLVVYSVVYIKIKALPGLDRAISARGRIVACIPPDTTRAMRYGLNYYAGTVVPDCPARQLK
jgi:4-amino-4-deoxy-L-arabinose transferase-like glycosyltransferase